MKRSDWLGGLRTTLGFTPRRRRRRANQPLDSIRRATFELLEDRRLLATLSVNSALDNTIAGDGMVTLREAIVAANTNTATDLGETGSGADTIAFDPAVFATSQTISLTLGELQITEPLSINGPGQELLTIDAQQQSRIFNITRPPAPPPAPIPSGDFGISGLMLTGGRTTGNSEGGGAIRAEWRLLTVDQCTIFGNKTEGDESGGGGILATSLSLTDSTLAANSTSGQDSGGGGIMTDRLTLVNSSVAGNSATGLGQFGGGGGIFTFGITTLINSSVTENTAMASGGGIRCSGSTLTFGQTRIDGNQSFVDGGGIYVTGPGPNITFVDSTINNNNAARAGGGIRALRAGIYLTNSSIDGNVAGSGGGGISIGEGVVTLTGTSVDGNMGGGISGGGGFDPFGISLTNSTVNGNGGGGINFSNGFITLIDSTVSNNLGNGVSAGLSRDGDLIVSNTTVSGNRGVGMSVGNDRNVLVAIVHSTVIDNENGGIVFGSNKPLLISHSIIAGNTDGGTNPDLNPGTGPLTLEYSLIGDTTGSGITVDTGTGNILDVDPLLGPLAYNGGPIQTHRLLQGSPAIDAGDPLAVAGVDGVPEFDQRGAPFGRVLDGDGVDGARIDMGAFEKNPNLDPSPFVESESSADVGAAEVGQSSYSFTIAYSDDSAVAVASIDTADVSVIGPGGALAVLSAEADVPSDGTPRTVTYTVEPPGGTWDSADNGAYTIELNLDEVGDDGTPPVFVAAGQVGLFVVNASADFGDAPDAAPGTSPGNYNTQSTDNGAGHTIVAGLHLGVNVDSDDGALQNVAANADDVHGALPDDEDGLVNLVADLVLTVGAQPTVNVRVTNTTGAVATLYGWIDYNGDGVFDNTTERASVAIPSSPFPGSSDAFVSKYDAAGNLLWTRQIGTASSDASHAVSTDGLGNVYISGEISGSLGGPNAGSRDAFVSKYDADGDFLWNRQLGSVAPDHSFGVSTDGPGNVYISGFTTGSLGGPNAGSSDAFVSKYDAAGNLQWTKQLGTTASDSSSGVSADGLGNIYISGETWGSLGGPNVGNSDAFVSKYDAAGNLLWTEQLGTTSEDPSYGVSTDGLGNVYISGFTTGSLGGPNAGSSDSFVSKYDAAGNLQWTKQLGTTASDSSSGVSTDGLGNVYITGSTTGSLGGPNSGSIDAFVSKYDAAGDLAWTQQLGTASEDRNEGVSADGLGNVYVSGYTRGNLGGPNAGNDDAFVSKYDAAGNLLWTRQLGTASSDQSHGVSTDGLGNVYISGSTNGSLGGSNADIVTLVFPAVPAGFTGTTYARFRLSTDAAASNPTGAASDGEVEDYRVTIMASSDGLADSTKTKKIASDTNGVPTLADNVRFGSSVASLGDIDGDGVEDLAVGAQLDAGGGAVDVLFLNVDGTVKASQKIANGFGGGPTLTSGDYFGRSVASLGDLDGDGVTDLAVGADRDNSGGTLQGAAYVLFLNSNGTVKNSQKIASGVGGGPTLANSDRFGSSVTAIGDFDGDGLTDLAVGASGDDSGGTDRGAVHVLLMNANGTVKSSQKIGSDTGGGPALSNGDNFGRSVVSLGDLDGDGVSDLAVGAHRDGTGGAQRGAVYVLFMNADGTVRSSQKIASGTTGGPNLADGDLFGRSIASLGDLDGDGVSDLAVGAFYDDAGGTNRGAVHVLFLNADGTVKQSGKIADGVGGGPTLADGDYFGSSVAMLGDLDGDGVTELAIGSEADDTGGPNRGAVHILFLKEFNSNPVITSADTANVPENSASVMTVTATDAEAPPQTVTFSIVGGSDAAAFSITTAGVLSFNSDPDFEAPTDTNFDNVYELTVEASDGKGGTATQTINVTVSPINDNSPVITSPNSVDVAENTTAVMTLAATDADLPAQLVTFSIIGGADSAKFEVTGDALVFSSAPDFELPGDANGDNFYEVTVEANDGNGGTASQTISVTVTPVNDNNPVFTSADVVGVTENSTTVFTVTATDADLPAQAVTFSAEDSICEANFGLNYFWFDAHQAGSTSTMDDFLVRDLDTNEIVYNNSFDSGLDELRTWFKSDGDEPWTDSSPMIRIVDGQLRLESTGFGQNGAGGYNSHAAVILEQSLPENFELSFVTQRLQWPGHSDMSFFGDLPDTPERDPVLHRTAGTRFEGNWGWDIETAYPIHASQFINVDARNTTNVKFVKQDETLSYYINGTLLDTATLEPADTTCAIVGGADQAKFAITSGGVLSFVSAPDFEAPTDANGDNVYELIVQASDGNGGTTTQTISVTVTPVNDNSPVFTSADTANVPENSTTVLTVTATDADLPAQSVTYSIVGGADQGEFGIAGDGALTFNSAPNFETPTDANGDNVYVVIIQASDGSRTEVQEALVTVTNVNELLDGDYNHNGTIDAADYTIWADQGIGSFVARFSGGDGNGNGVVDNEDYLIWKNNFGNTQPGGGGGNSGTVASTLAEPVPNEQQTSVESATTTASTFSQLDSNAMESSAPPTDFEFNIDRPRSKDRRSLGRERVTAAASQDRALVAWLASRPANGRREFALVDDEPTWCQPESDRFSDRLGVRVARSLAGE